MNTAAELEPLAILFKTETNQIIIKYSIVMIKNGSLVISVNTGAIVRVLDYSPKDYFKGTIIGKDTTKKYLYRNFTPIGRTLGVLDKTPFIPYYQPYKKLKLI